MPRIPPPRARPASFRAPVHHSTRPMSRPVTPTFRPPVHRDTPPARPPEHHHPNPLPTIVAATMLNNSMNHGTPGNGSISSSSALVRCHLCGKNTPSAVNHDGENYCQECVGKLLHVVSEQKKSAAIEASGSLDNLTVDYLDEQFKAWENGEKDKAAKLGEQIPAVEPERPVENERRVVKEGVDDDEDDEDDDEDEDDDHHGTEPARFEGMERVFGSKSSRPALRSPMGITSSIYPRHCYKSRGRSNAYKQYGVAICLIACAIAAAYFSWPYLGISIYAAPTPAYRGPFTGATIHVVDGDTGLDISGQISLFELYISNDTSNYESYWYIGNGTTINEMYAAAGSIDENVTYAAIVLYTDVYAPYADSWDYLEKGDNYVYVYK